MITCHVCVSSHSIPDIARKNSPFGVPANLMHKLILSGNERSAVKGPDRRVLVLVRISWDRDGLLVSVVFAAIVVFSISLTSR